MGYLSRLGIIGWDDIEAIIFASVLSNKSILLVGPHGANKTEGCQVISKAMLGEKSKFVPYDTSLVNADDLLGYPNPAALQAGRIEFISTPDSIWDAESCLLDELNRCNPYNAAKFFEIVRARTINGRTTALKFVWAACNPPDKYNTAHMDPAQVSRFMVLRIPVFGDFNETQKRNLLHPEAAVPTDLGKLLDSARNAKIPANQVKLIEQKVIKIANTLAGKQGIQFSGRQVKDLHTLFLNMDRVSMTFKDTDKVSESVMLTAVMGLIPESTGLIRNGIDPSAIKGEIATILKGFQLSDPILTAASLADLAAAETKDMQGWAGAFTDMLMVEEEPAQVLAAWKVVEKRSDLAPDIFNSLRQSFASKRVMLSIKDPKKVLAISLSNEIETSLAQLGAKKAPATAKKPRK